METPAHKYVPYRDDIEVQQPNEAELIERIVASMRRQNQRNFERHRHGIRDAHAKSHGVLRGELTVYRDLPEHLRQGLFREPRVYPLFARLSSAPGSIAPRDAVPTVFGMALKLLGVEGKKLLPGHEDELTQDFLFGNFPVIPFGHVASYLPLQERLERQSDSELAGRTTAALAGMASPVLKVLGQSHPLIEALAKPRTHILGETFHSMAALRYGDYFGKLSAAPLSEELRGLSGQRFGADTIVRDLVVEYFQKHSAEYELRVQLCTDLERMPIEDGSVLWREDESPHQAIGKISFPVQDAYSPARRVYADDVLSFSPWHCLPEHRPLGSIMRVRRSAYESSSKFRHEMNARPRGEPRDASEMPE